MSEDRAVEQAQANKEPVARESEDLLAQRLEELRRCFPEAFVEGKVDFERLRAALGDIVEDGPERYTFTWAGKRDALRLLQMPTRATLLPYPEESVDWETTQNVFIEGDNLEALKLLLRPYYGWVKMIYIDPPYNTGNDFIYRDDYRDPLGAYLQMTGQRDEAGNLLTSNPETSGRYHSAWLSMMYPRLFLARQLLREDGVIFISIDDHELSNVSLLMNEVFGEENFVCRVIWKKRSTPPNDQIIGTQHDYILLYCRDANQLDLRLKPRTPEQLARYSNPDGHPKGPWTPGDLMANVKGGRYVESLYFPIINPRTGEAHYPSSGGNWRFNRETIARLIANNEIDFGEDGRGRPRLKRFLCDVKDGITWTSIWDFVPFNTAGSEEMNTIFGNPRVFENPKPCGLVTELLRLATGDKDIVLDFFAGSCTTAQAVLELNREDGGNRRFIMVQLPEPTAEGSAAREAGFETIAEIGKERIRRVIARLKEQNQGKLDLPDRETPEDLGFRVYKLAPSNYRSWRGVEAEGDEPPSPETYVEQMEMFTEALADGWTPEGVIAEVALKEAGFGLNYQVETVHGLQEQTVYRVMDPDREQVFYLCLDDTVRLEALKPLGLERETLFVCRASALNDETAANLALQCRLRVI